MKLRTIAARSACKYSFFVFLEGEKWAKEYVILLGSDEYLLFAILYSEFSTADKAAQSKKSNLKLI